MDRISHLSSRLFLAAIAQRAALVRCAAIALLLATSSRELRANGIDRVYLISTRGIGTRCECSAMHSGLQCEELVAEGYSARHWRSVEWSDVAAELAEPLPTVIYVHGNRVDPGFDKTHGLEIYRSLAARKPSGAPIRYIIWSWPSSKVSGIINDYQVKAARTRPVAWQLAWAVDQMPPETPLTLVGHSYGARVVTGTLHLLAGGRLGDLELVDRTHPVRPPIRAALLAAAVDASWIRPGGFHGRALELVDEALLVNNHRDPAMRFYHLAFEGHVRPLGYGGISGLGQFADRVRTVDVTPAVGRRHALEDYLVHSRRVVDELEQFVQLRPITPLDAALATGELSQPEVPAQAATPAISEPRG
jgi:hypothetical protein